MGKRRGIESWGRLDERRTRRLEIGDGGRTVAAESVV